VDLDRERLRDIARLAQIELTPPEEDRLAREMAKILEHIDRIGELDTTGIEPLLDAVDLVNVSAPDEATPSLGTSIALEGAPEADEEMFRIPSVLGRDG
jgi:aspartyl-tRNA(Asn)/glutamyl-tRNA(Gln) amidotransferase subunit C